MAFLAAGSYVPVRKTVPQPAVQQPVQVASAPMPSQSLSLSGSSRMTTTPMTFAPTQFQQPKRQAVNDPGYFGQQAGALNSVMARMLDPSYMDVNTTDRDIAPMVQAIDRQGQTTARLGQAQAAERAAADGTLQSGGFANEAQQIFEQARRGSGDQIAGLVNEKSRERQAQIMQALELGGNLLDSQAKMNLQRELADLENAQKFNELSLNRDLGFGKLNLDSALGYGDLDVRNRGLDIQHELGLGDLGIRRTQTTNQNNQFYDRLGFDQSSFEATMNSNIIRQLLGY